VDLFGEDMLVQKASELLLLNQGIAERRQIDILWQAKRDVAKILGKYFVFWKLCLQQFARN
jgi:hypothetical protein